MFKRTLAVSAVAKFFDENQRYGEKNQLKYIFVEATPWYLIFTENILEPKTETSISFC